MNQTSPFLKLPPEIRAIIYQHHLGGKTFHVFRTVDDNPRIRQCLCPFQGRRSHLLSLHDGTPYCYCVSREDGHGEQLTAEAREKLEPQSSRLSLLLACRQTYSEVVPILIGHNAFNIQAQFPVQLQAVAGMRDLMPQRCFHAIRMLEISFCCSTATTQITHLDDRSFFVYWAEMCATVSDMQGLLSLHIWVNIDQDEPVGRVLTADQEATILRPLLAQEWSRLNHFQLEVSWPPTTESARLLSKAHFTLVRMENPYSPWMIPPDLKQVNLFFG